MQEQLHNRQPKINENGKNFAADSKRSSNSKSPLKSQSLDQTEAEKVNRNEGIQNSNEEELIKRVNLFEATIEAISQYKSDLYHSVEQVEVADENVVSAED